MNSGLTVEVTNLSPNATEKDVYDFFSFSGQIEHIEIMRSGDYSSTAYVTFKEAHALETACLLSGATIADQRVYISRWGNYEDQSYALWAGASWNNHDDAEHSGVEGGLLQAISPGEAVTMAQDMVKAMLSKGFVLSRDALAKARDLDESHRVSATAAAKIAELGERIGLVGKIAAGLEAVRAVDGQYHVSESTMAAVSATGRTAAAAANAIVNSSYFSAGPSSSPTPSPRPPTWRPVSAAAAPSTAMRDEDRSRPPPGCVTYLSSLSLSLSLCHSVGT
ncbi:unnamed protein product [Spirodela intermedia]|uniref:RRM domain-containing protein n=1 Tax=Spirodela intermedia TaxID=51605 RepID=A0A7I8J307_SPIIN|nr:unnamed protein product [Spirodela intermedia]CAA6664497.1 unnamed protein product [Spirodela intermedia]